MFCCDQIKLRELSRITDNTWKFWSRDMREFILEKESDKDFQDALDNFSNTKTQKYKYYTNMMDKSNDRKFDPLLPLLDLRLQINVINILYFDGSPVCKFS